MGGRGRSAARTEAAIGHLPGIGPDAPRSTPTAKEKRRAKKGTNSTSVAQSWKRRSAYFIGRWFGVIVEASALGVGALVAIALAMSRFSQQFAGDSLTENLLPFAAAVLGLCVASAIFLKAWFTWRLFITRLGRFGHQVPVIVALCLGGGAAFSWATGTMRQDVRQLQALVGGSAESARATIAHQVFAHYRRANLEQTSRMISQGMAYDAAVRDAGAALGVSHEILMGIAATESSFHPRPSKDGGEGLFQVTKPPTAALTAAKDALGVTELNVKTNHRHNIFVGAATFRHYLEQMDADLFLALLAYNIGPHNGGLRSIMQNYGATDSVTIQPYLKDLPRDYPIRVLSAALAYRLWTTHFGKLPRYEEGSNAIEIQELGIPGLERASGFPELAGVGN